MAAIVPDLARRCPAAGYGLARRGGTVAAAVRQKAFARSLKQPVLGAGRPRRVWSNSC